MIALAALLCLVAPQWSTVPNAERKVTIELPLTTLTDVVAEIRKQANLPIQVTGIPERKLTVLVKDMKAGDLLEEIADVLELKVSVFNDKVGIAELQAARQSREAYLYAEDAIVSQSAKARLDALAAALPSVLEPAKEGDSWALKKVRTPAGYAAALIRRASLNANLNERLNQFPLGAGMKVFDTAGYAFKIPPNARVAAQGHRSLDEFSKQFEGTQVLLRYRPVTGSWMAKGISGADPGKIDDDPKLLPYPRPPKALSQHPYAVGLVEWAKDDPDSKLGDEKIAEEGEAPEPLFPGQGLALADHLAWLHAHSKANVVATAFRMPTGLAKADLPGSTVGTCLKYLAEKTDCFVSVSKRCVRVRHGGYWRLAACEPSEALLRPLEAATKQRDLTLDDYGSFAAALDVPVFERFEGPDRFLANFDLKPLQRGVEILSLYGKLSAQQRRALWNGEVVRGYQGPDDARASNQSDDSLVFPKRAIQSCMGGVSIVGRFADVLEYATDSGSYLKANGMRDPYWEGSFTWPQHIKLILPTEGSSQNVGIFVTPNDRDGVLFWLKGQ